MVYVEVVVSIDIEVPLKVLVEAGDWLDEKMPNPPLPEPQRWTVGSSIDGREGIRFQSEEDAIWFKLRWG